MRLLDLDESYNYLVDRVLDGGWHREGRNGGTTMMPGMVLRHEMRTGFPLLTTRKIFWKGVAAELAGFLEGSTSLARFKELGCNYWDKNANEWAKFDGDNLGPIYGAQWRDFNGVDQLQQLLEGLHTNPTGRRHVMTTWNPAQTDDMCLPPCHILTQFHVTGKLLHQTVYMRSVDLCLGLPSDLVLYGLLHVLVARELKLLPAELTFMLGDAHVYDEHDDLWQIQRTRQGTTRKPTLVLAEESTLWSFHPSHCSFLNYEPHEAMSYALK